MGEVVTKPRAASRGRVIRITAGLEGHKIGSLLYLRMVRLFPRIAMAIVSGLCLLVATTSLILAWFHGWSGAFKIIAKLKERS